MKLRLILKGNESLLIMATLAQMGWFSPVARSQAATDEQDFVAPKVIAGPSIVYPSDGQGISLEVPLLLTIDERGNVVEAEIVEPIETPAHSSFRESALAAAKTLRFEPARQNAQAVRSQIQYRMWIGPPSAEAPGTKVARLPFLPATNLPAPQVLTVRSKRPPPSRGASDFYVETGALRYVSRRPSASQLLQLAPGIFLSNEGGEGHADAIYLRGFAAGEGQDFELTVQGVPINEPANPHGDGLANPYFIIPELVQAVRVIEGPFDPHQGNYAVAGSAEYELSMPERGAHITYQIGSFNTHRVLIMQGPENLSADTFAAADLRKTGGFGQNRASRHARLMTQYAWRLGREAELRLFASAFANKYGSAGVIRDDDYDAGRIGFFDSYDTSQGGDARRFDLSADLRDQGRSESLRQQVFVTLRDSRQLVNPTGFVEDPPSSDRVGFIQRGDMEDLSHAAVSLGARGSMRFRQSWQKREQSFELGYYARYDRANSAQQRLEFGTRTPYRTDFDYRSAIANLAVFADSEVRPLPLLTVHGGLRGDFFNYNILNRESDERVSASAFAFLPRIGARVGPQSGFSLVGNLGRGARAMDPVAIGEANTPSVIDIWATEGGITYQELIESISVNARALYYYTFVSQNFIFDPHEGRNVLRPGADRQGFVLASRLMMPWLDWSSSLTYAHARFTDPTADSGKVVPYIPNWVFRSDIATHGILPWRLDPNQNLLGHAALGLSYISSRALPHGAMSDAFFVADASCGARVGYFELDFSIQNLLNHRYRLGEFNYVSNFNPQSVTPDLLPARHFTAGMPRTFLLTLTVHSKSAPEQSL